MDARQEARVLERDRVVADEGLCEEPLDRIGRAARDREAEVGRRDVRSHPRERPALEAGVDDRLAVEHRSAGQVGEHATGIGDEVGIGVAGRHVAEHAVGGEPLLRDGGPVGDVRAAAAARHDHAGRSELAVGGDGGVAVHPQVVSEVAHRRQRVAGMERAALDERAHARGDVGGRPAGDLEGHVMDHACSVRVVRSMLSFGLGQAPVLSTILRERASSDEGNPP